MLLCSNKICLPVSVAAITVVLIRKGWISRFYVHTGHVNIL